MQTSPLVPPKAPKLQALRTGLRRWLSSWDGRVTATLVVGALLFTGWTAASGGSAALRLIVSDVAQPMGDLLAAAVVLRLARHPQLDVPQQRAWTIIGLALLANFVGNAIWGWQEITLGVEPFPSWADAAYLAYYPLMLYGAWLLPRTHLSVNSIRLLLLDAVIMLAAGGVLTYVTFGYNAAAVGGAGIVETVLAFGYPVADLVLLGALLLLASRGSDLPTRRVTALLAGGLYAVLVADLTFAYLTLQGEFRSGSALDSLWLWGSVLPAVAARWQALNLGESPLPGERREVSPDSSPALWLLPHGILMLVYGLMALEVAIRHPTHMTPLLVVFGFVLFLVVVRQYCLHAENERLIRRTAEMAAQLQEAVARFEALVRNTSDVILVTGPDRVIRYVGGPVRDGFGHEPEALVGRPLVDLVGEPDREKLIRVLSEVSASAGRPTRSEWRFRCADGSLRWVEAILTNLEHDPHVRGLVLSLRDVEERKRKEARWQRQALYDELTDLANRRHFMQRIAEELQRVRQQGGSVAVGWVDLDGFKRVNDTLGHGAGDKLLTELAARLRAVVRGGDIVSRLGGDEFGLLLRNVEEAQLHQIAARLLRTLTEPVEIDGQIVSVGASVGFAVSTTGEEDPEALLEEADRAMYRSKREKRTGEGF